MNILQAAPALANLLRLRRRFFLLQLFLECPPDAPPSSWSLSLLGPAPAAPPPTGSAPAPAPAFRLGVGAASPHGGVGGGGSSGPLGAAGAAPAPGATTTRIVPPVQVFNDSNVAGVTLNVSSSAYGTQNP